MATAVKQKSSVVLDYLRPHKKMPTVWCAGLTAS